MSVPEGWAARVMEAFIRVRNEYGGRMHDILADDVVTKVLLELRIGKFLPGNLNMFKRYTFDTFRCHLCNTVLPPGAHAPDTTAHLSLHRNQVKQALRPEARFTDDWEHTDEPTEEEVRQEDERITGLEQKARAGFYQEVRR